MAEAAFTFDDSAAYERFMGRWSRAVAPRFIDWLKPPRRAGWLDVGCGTGILTETVLELCAPATLHAIDPAGAQIAAAVRRLGASAAFQVGDARALPFPGATFDVVGSALVLNFIPDQGLAMQEMRRVTRPGGMIAGYVWDFAEDLSPSGPLRQAMRRHGADVPAIPGTGTSRPDALAKLFAVAGLENVDTTVIDVCLAYTSFEDFWEAQTVSYAPTTKIIAAMTKPDRGRLIRMARASLHPGPNGSIEYFARANAVKGRVPL